jgi:hypothetical protein
LTGADDIRPALNGGFGLRNVLAMDGINSKREEASESLASGTEADIALHERNVAREVEDGVARKVVRLELIKI